MRWILLAAVLVGCGGEFEPIELKANGVECSESTECASNCCGTAELVPLRGECMQASICGG